MRDFRDKIIAAKKAELERAQARTSLASLRVLAEESAPVRSLEEQLARNRQSDPDGLAILLAADPGLDPDFLSLIRAHDTAVDALVVATDAEFLGGDPRWLAAIRAETVLPVIRQDFIIDEYQIYESKSLGADSYELYPGLLDEALLQFFLEVGRDFGMEAVVRIADEADLAVACATDAKIFVLSAPDGKGELIKSRAETLKRAFDGDDVYCLWDIARLGAEQNSIDLSQTSQTNGLVMTSQVYLSATR